MLLAPKSCSRALARAGPAVVPFAKIKTVSPIASHMFEAMKRGRQGSEMGLGSHHVPDLGGAPRVDEDGSRAVGRASLFELVPAGRLASLNVRHFFLTSNDHVRLRHCNLDLHRQTGDEGDGHG